MTRILFVDDETRLLDGLRRTLWAERSAWEMAFEVSGPAALDRMALQPPDIVVSDVRMPGMDGTSFLREVRDRFPGTARIVLTGHSEEQDLFGLVGLAHQFLVKPCPPDDLRRVIARVAGALAVLAPSPGLATAIGAFALLPYQPSAVDALEAALTHAGSDDRKVAEVLERDVALTAKALQLVNTSFFAPGKRITSVADAVRRLSPPTVRGVVTELRRCGPCTVPLPSQWLREVNTHALTAARSARAKASPGREDDAFCAGLLHVVGPLAVAAGTGRVTRCATAAADHALAAGACLLGLWGMPPDVVAAALDHLRECEV